MTPLQIQLAIAVGVSGAPEQYFTSSTWRSEAMRDAKEWLVSEGLAIKTEAKSFQSTEKLNAYIDYLCAMPLPVAKWVIDPNDITGAQI